MAGRLSEKPHRLFPVSIKTNILSPPLLINRGSNGVTGTVLVSGDPEQSTGGWSHESLSTENTLQNKHSTFFFSYKGLNPLTALNISRQEHESIKVCPVVGL